MPPKNKKNKRKESKNKHENEEKATKTIEEAKHAVKNIENFSDFFKNTEVEELKSVLKADNLSGISLIMGASILNKPELLKSFLKQGHNINEIGSHHTTALIWAVKCKNLQIIELLLNRGADPTIKSDTGDHVLLVALESKLWDEESFLSLWNNVKNVTFIDVDYKSKCGHSMLHIAVRREWKNFINILITEKANMNITNKNGITPLMLACFRNNEQIVKMLLKAGANVLKEDEKGCISLCYAISSVVLRNEKPPFNVIEEIITELKKKGMSLKDYLKKCVNMISNPVVNCDSTQSSADIVAHIVSFAVFHMHDGLKILLELDIFSTITNALKKFENNLKYLCTTLGVLNELLCYSENYNNFSRNVEKSLIDNYFISGCAMACLTILKKCETCENNQLFSSAIFPIISTCLYDDLGREWLYNNYADMLPYTGKILETNIIPSTYRSEYNKKMAKKKIKIFTEHIIKLKNKFVTYQEEAFQENAENDEFLEDVRQESKSCSKKTKRRSKALKAKIAKIKSADLTQRLNMSDRKLNAEHRRNVYNVDSSDAETACKIKTTKETLPRNIPCEETEIVSGIKVMLRRLQFQCEHEESLSDLKNGDSKHKGNNVDQLYGHDLDENESVTKIEADLFRTCLQSTLQYFSAFLQKIIAEYRKNWKNDKEFGYNVVRRGQGDSSTKSNETTECWKSNLENLEKKYIEHLEVEFEKLIVCIREQAQNDPEVCRVALGKLENLLTNHKIRGKTVTLENDIMANVKPIAANQNIENTPTEKDFIYTNYFEYSRPLDNLHFSVDEVGNENYPVNYIEETQDMLYYREMMSLPKPKKIDQEKAAQMKNKTLANAYHLIPSILAICDSENEYELEENTQSEDCNVDIMTMSSSSSTNMRMPKPKSEYSSVIMQALTKCAENNVIVGGAKSRWSDLICSLQNLNNCQILFSGDLRISCGSKRYNYVISTGGNFNPVELGLDINNRPLAVKRIPKESSVCKTLKTLLNPLMGIRNSYILHYFICDYEGNDLIFATPLCEFNIGQYVMLLKQMPNVRLSANEAVKQFLSGLMYLHTQKEPIVHGNLKPSNIFVDIHGSVRVAEFGIHKALFKLNEAPDSSIIWFAPETYKTFKESLVMECTCSSDIQVAGMLVHFILTGGKHPYGDETKEILKNLEKATPQLITHDVDLQDLITWMLLFDPNERPVIKQVLTHVYFWSTERKWCFILSCAGISSHGSSLPIEINAFHEAIDKIAAKENIKGCWVKVIKQKFPELSCISDDDTPTGLLRFIRSCVEKKTCLEMSNDELCRYILSAFPAFPLSLYRMLESSSWLKHPILTSFTMVDSVFS